MAKKIIIIGGGLSALSASCYLAKNNFDVTIIDKNNSMGGRLTSFKAEGFTFDMGPSWYWMPDVFDKFFHDFGKKTSDYYILKRLDPSYKFYTSEYDIDIPSKLALLYELFEKIEPGSSLNLKKFLDQAKIKYNISMQKFIELPNHSLFEYFSTSILKHAFSLNLLSSLRTYISKNFKSSTLRDLLEFPSMFLGGSPQNTPALYSLMNYADIVQGTWYPIGGMNVISKSFEKLSLELGVKHINNEEISRFSISNKKIKSIYSKNENKYVSDLYLSCMEYPHVQLNILNKNDRSYNSKYWESKNIAPSALIFYIGLSKKIKNLEHHNLFFDKDFNQHIDQIFNKKVWPLDPLFYVCCPSKTDSSVIPNKDCENLFILIPIGAGSKDSNEIRDLYFDKVISRIEAKNNQRLKDLIIFKESFCVKDFSKRYNSYKGNAYGLANTLFQTAIFKPKLKDKKIKNLYYTGHFTVPGPGLPPAVISGKIVANQIIKDN